MRLTVAFLLLVILATAFPGVGVAQYPHWTKIDSVKNPDYEIMTPYFINPDVGFVFYASSVPRLQRTTDGGATWTSLPMFDTLNCHLAQLYFVSLTHGYAAATTIPSQQSSVPQRGGVFETTDAGDHWRALTRPDLSINSVYARDSMICAAGNELDAFPYNTLPAQIFLSTNNGLSWDSLVNRGTYNILWTSRVHTQDSTPPLNYSFANVVGNRDGFIALIVTGYEYYSRDLNQTIDTSILLFSTDDGMNWEPGGRIGSSEQAAFSLFNLPHRYDLVRQWLSGEDATNDTYSFLHTSDEFMHSDSTLMHTETSANLTGNSCVQYVSSANDQNPGQGLLRSEDGGTIWSLVPGPDFGELDDHDSRNISVVGNGAVIYAVSNVDGFLYKSTDGGDSTLSAAGLAPIFSIAHAPFVGGSDTLRAYSCDTTIVTIISQSLGCTYGKFIGLRVDSLPPSEYSWSIVATHAATDHLPDTAILRIMPGGVGDQHLVIHAEYLTDEFEMIDSSITVPLTLVPGSGVQLAAYQKQANIVGVAGDTISIPVYINGGSITGSGTTSLLLDYDMNTNVVAPVQFKPALVGVNVSVQIVSESLAAAQLNSSTELHFQTETLLGWLRCVLMLSDSLSTNVVLSTVTTSSSQSHCLTEANNFDTVFILVAPTCADSLLRNYMMKQLPSDITGVSPNPATTTLHVRFRNMSHETLAYELFDALGRTCQAGSTASESTTIDLTGLRPGTYYLRAVSAEGPASSRKILILH